MTDERSSDPELVLRAEGLVAKLATAEPDWDALALRVSARLDEAPAPDALLLAAPFPEVEGESALDRLVVAKPAAASVEREALSLADLARATVARRGARDAANIAKESLAVASQSRSQGERAAALVKAEVAAPPPAPSSRRSRPSRPSLADSRGPWIGVGIAALGLAAGFGLYFAGQRRAPEVIVTAPNSEVIDAPEARAAALTETKPLELGVASLPQALDQLPAASAAVPALAAEAVEKSARALVPAAPERSAQAAKPAGAGRPFAAGVPPERVVLEEDRAGEKSGASSPGKAAESSPLRPAELAPRESGPTDRPSAGAAQAAVGAVLGAARGCIAGHSAPSSATLVFGSDGQVSRVNVTGPAAGTPAASCVESALKKARVQPFAAESFSLGVTVRPP